MPTSSDDAATQALLRAYLDAITLAEPLQSRLWSAAQLTLTQIRTLRKLAREPLSLGQLAASLGLPPPSVTRLVDRLEERGLIERRRDDSDRRRVVAVLLPPGRSLVGELPLLEGSTIKAAAEGLAPADRARIALAFEEFAAAVRTADEAQSLETAEAAP